jgi:hypothetical protein
MNAQSGAARVRLARLIWVALVLCVLIYGVIAAMVTGETDSPVASADDLFLDPAVLVLAMVAVADFLFALLVPKFLFRSVGTGVATPLSPSAELTLSQRLLGIFVVQWALMESVAIFGLVAAFLFQDLRLFVAFGALSILGLVLTFPGEGRIRAHGSAG